MEILKGLKVVELASVLAGPAVGMFFAELGAEVIKIENSLTDGDVTRQWKNSREEGDAPVSAYYASVNWGKEVRMLDLKTKQAKSEVGDLIADADIVICNFKTGSAAKLGLDYTRLSAQNPKLIYGQINGFPGGEPRPAFDVVLQAEAGFLYMTGHPDGAPAKMPVAIIDLIAAHQLKEGILLALLQREKTGRGAYVETSLLGSALASLANQATNWLMSGLVPQRMGCAHPNIAPYGDLFSCLDGGQVVVAAGTQRQFEALCHCLSLTGLVSDQRFSSNSQRVVHRDELRSMLAKAIGEIPVDELMGRLRKSGVPVGRLRNMQEVFDQEVASSMILEDELSPGILARRLRTVAFSISDAH